MKKYHKFITIFWLLLALFFAVNAVVTVVKFGWSESITDWGLCGLALVQLAVRKFFIGKRVS